MVFEVAVGIDTNIFISVINKETDFSYSKRILDWIDEGKLTGLVSTIVLAEICSGYEMESADERDDFLAYVLGSANYKIIDVTVPLALEAGKLRAKKSLKLPDALIVASALRHSGEFLVSNDSTIGNAVIEGLKVTTAAKFVRHFDGSRSKS